MAMETAIKTKKIDAVQPLSAPQQLRRPADADAGIQRAGDGHDHPRHRDVRGPERAQGRIPRHGGGQRTGGGDSTISQGVSASRRSGPIGHGEAQDRVTLLPESGFDMQVLIPDGIFANPFGSPLGRPRDPASGSRCAGLQQRLGRGAGRMPRTTSSARPSSPSRTSRSRASKRGGPSRSSA